MDIPAQAWEPSRSVKVSPTPTALIGDALANLIPFNCIAVRALRCGTEVEHGLLPLRTMVGRSWTVSLISEEVRVLMDQSRPEPVFCIEQELAESDSVSAVVGDSSGDAKILPLQGWA